MASVAYGSWRTASYCRWRKASSAALIPAARAVVLDNAGHMAHIDQPDQWITAVGEFLE